MSWGTCYSLDQIIYHFGFPPIMTDGRNYAQWQPGAVVNKTLREEAMVLKVIGNIENIYNKMLIKYYRI